MSENKEVQNLWNGLDLKYSDQLMLTHFVLKQFEKPIKERINKDSLMEIAYSLSSNKK